MIMFKTMARLAKRNAIGRFVSQFWIRGKRLDMVRVQFNSMAVSAAQATTLASVVVTLQNGTTPMLVTPETAIVARRGAFVFTGCKVSTFLAAILGFEVSVLRNERRSAMLTNERGRRSVASADKFGRTRTGTRFTGKDRNPPERCTTDNASPVMARFAIRATRICRYELVSAPVATSSPCGNGRLVFHTPMIPQNAQIDKLERWATMTGKTPTLLDGAP